MRHHLSTFKDSDSVLLCNHLLPRLLFSPGPHQCRWTQPYIVSLPDLTSFILRLHILRKWILLVGYLVMMTLLSCFAFPQVTEKDYLKTHIGVQTHTHLFDHLFVEACLDTWGPPSSEFHEKRPIHRKQQCLCRHLRMSLSSFIGPLRSNLSALS